MNTRWPTSFLYACCQRGAENALKHEISQGGADLRPAFSRPGYVTFKSDSPFKNPREFRLASTFARSWGFCLGKVRGEMINELAERTWQLPEVEAFLEAEQIVDIHAWERDSAQPGERGFSPGVSALAAEARETLLKSCPIEDLKNLSGTTRRNRWVLDAVLIEPNEWWIGCHYTARRQDCWPGGVPPLELPEHAVSRAYLKMKEALTWSALPITRGDVCVELGCAPGGASQALLETGAQVIGVDPAEVDPVVLEDSRFKHLRCRTTDIPYKRLRGMHWLAADMNVAPNYTLDAAEAIVSRNELQPRGMVLTLKLADWKLAAEIPKFVERVKSWGYQDVRLRQLAFNRQEICLIALRSRSQRRVRRSKTKFRKDKPHAGKLKRPHI